MRVRFAKKFDKLYDRAPIKIPQAFNKRLELFIQNQFHPQLNNHKLTGLFKGYRSINVTGDWRAIYSEYKDKDDEIVIVFELLGTHSQLYK